MERTSVTRLLWQAWARTQSLARCRAAASARRCTCKRSKAECLCRAAPQGEQLHACALAYSSAKQHLSHCACSATSALRTLAEQTAMQGPHSKSICFGLMIRRKYSGTPLRCAAPRLPPLAVVVGNIQLFWS